MSLLDDASLLVTPNAEKATKLYSIIPTNGNGDFTVTRATTATRTNSSGLIENTPINEPRLDYSLGSCPNILLEPQRTNNARWSEDLTNGAWTKNTGVTITADNTISPSGIQNADRVVGATGAAIWASINTLNQQIGGFTSSTLCIITIYLRSSTTSSQVTLALRDQSTGLATSLVCNLTSSWQRFEISRTTGATTTALGVVLGAATADFFAWGLQGEAGAYATSYIPTTSASVTRNLDVVQKTGVSSLIGQTEGTIYWEGTLTSGQADDIFFLNRNLTNSVFLYKTTANQIFLRIYYNSASIAFGSASGYTGNVKIAAAYKSGNTILYVNGVQVGTSATAFAFTAALSDIVLNNSTFFLGNATKSVKTAALFPTRLTNAQLAALTA
jgi:hypothetical protein